MTSSHSAPTVDDSHPPYSIDSVGMPAATITRIFKDTVPDHMSLSRETRIGMNHATVTFVNYITALAHEITTKAKKKTLSAADMLSAVESAGLHEFLPVLRLALDQYQKQRQDKKGVPQTDNLPSSATTLLPTHTSASSPSHHIVNSAGDEDDEEIDIMDES